MNATPIVIATVLILIIAYRYYYGFVVARLAMINDIRQTPSQRLFDGQNYYPMNKWILFGHHFAAIAGAGPLVGPVLAVQFGYCPGLLWILAGAVLAGSMHDFIILVASVKYDGKSLVEIARAEINKVSGVTASIAVLIILVVAIAGLGMVVVNALAESAWGTFTIAATNGTIN
jgi:carbon starvation protein